MIYDCEATLLYFQFNDNLLVLSYVEDKGKMDIYSQDGTLYLAVKSKKQTRRLKWRLGLTSGTDAGNAIIEMEPRQPFELLIHENAEQQTHYPRCIPAMAI